MDVFVVVLFSILGLDSTQKYYGLGMSLRDLEELPDVS